MTPLPKKKIANWCFFFISLISSPTTQMQQDNLNLRLMAGLRCFALFLFLVLSLKFLSCIQIFVAPWTAAYQASLSITIFWNLLNSCPLSLWCHQTISSSVIPFSSCLQSFPASQSFLMSQFFTSGGQSIDLQLQHQSFQWIFRTDFL